MNIAIDISPLESGHKVRGTGSYVSQIRQALQTYVRDMDYTFFTPDKPLTGIPDIVHYPYFDPFFRTLPFRKKFPTVVTVHDLIPLLFPEHFPAGVRGTLKWLLQKESLKRADMIITDSEASKKDICKLAGISPEKVKVIYLAASVDYKTADMNIPQFKQLSEKYSLPSKFILYVGDATWNKNLPRLVQAVKEANVTLVIAGKALAEKNIDRTNPWNEDLIEVQQAVKDDKRFIILGYLPQEELTALYRYATLTVVPSLYEGFGLPVLEAMQSGCPVVTTRGGSLPEVAGNAAQYVDAYDMRSIANGIGEIFFSRTLQKEFRAKGLEQAKKFSWEKAALETAEVYREVWKKYKS